MILLHVLSRGHARVSRAQGDYVELLQRPVVQAELRVAEILPEAASYEEAPDESLELRNSRSVISREPVFAYSRGARQHKNVVLVAVFVNGDFIFEFPSLTSISLIISPDRHPLN